MVSPSPISPTAEPPQPAISPALTPKAQRKRSFGTLRTVVALILREMSTKYGRTPGGYLWAVAEPLAAILFLSIGFSLVMRSPSLGTSFLLFYASGYLPFGIYGKISNTTQSALRYSSALLKYPAVTWVDAILARFLLNSLTEIVVGALLIGGIMAIVDAHARLVAGPILEAVSLALLLGLGVGTLNCVLAGLFPLWGTIWAVLTRPLFLASGVIFLYEDLPALGQNILWYNPLMHITGLFRTGVYPTYTGAHINHMYVICVALVLLTFGLLLMGRYHRDVLNRR